MLMPAQQPISGESTHRHYCVAPFQNTRHKKGSTTCDKLQRLCIYRFHFTMMRNVVVKINSATSTTSHTTISDDINEWSTRQSQTWPGYADSRPTRTTYNAHIIQALSHQMSTNEQSQGS